MRWLWLVILWWALATGMNKPWLEAWNFSSAPHSLEKNGRGGNAVNNWSCLQVMKPTKTKLYGVQRASKLTYPNSTSQKSLCLGPTRISFYISSSGCPFMGLIVPFNNLVIISDSLTSVGSSRKSEELKEGVVGNSVTLNVLDRSCKTCGTHYLWSASKGGQSCGTKLTVDSTCLR